MSGHKGQRIQHTQLLATIFVASVLITIFYSVSSLSSTPYLITHNPILPEVTETINLIRPTENEETRVLTKVSDAPPADKAPEPATIVAVDDIPGTNETNVELNETDKADKLSETHPSEFEDPAIIAIAEDIPAHIPDTNATSVSNQTIESPETSPSAEMERKVKIITFASPANPHLCKMIKSVLSNDLDIKILALHTETKGKNFKFEKPKNYLKESGRNLNSSARTLYVYVDAYDVFFQNGPKEILASFDKLVRSSFL
jgi:hypothetical protein